MGMIRNISESQTFLEQNNFAIIMKALSESEANEWRGITPPMLNHKCHETAKRHAWVHILTLGLFMLHT